jgi:predicted signal transduction protein with EAL and GGDEF domain
MAYEELPNLLHHVGKDFSRLMFEDELTGLNNRRFLHNYFEYTDAWDESLQHPLSLLMMDADEFKQINHRQGHESGDQVRIWSGRWRTTERRCNGTPQLSAAREKCRTASDTKLFGRNAA